MKKRNNFTLKFTMIEIGVWTMYAPVMGYISVFLLSKKFSNAEIGLISALGCSISAILQVIVSRYADKEESKSVKSLLIYIETLQLMLAGSLFILKDSSTIVIGIIFGIMIAILQLIVPLANSLAVETMNQDKKINYGAARGISSLLFAVLINLMGVLIKSNGLVVIPAVMVITAIILLVATILFPFKRTILKNIEKRSSQNSKMFLFKYPMITLFLLGAVCTYVGHSLVNIYLFQIVTSKGGDNIGMSICLSLTALYEMPVMVGFTALLMKKSSNFLTRLGSVGIMLKIVLTLFVNDMAGLYIIQVCQMFGYAIFVVSTVYYANQEVEKCDRIKGQAYMTMVSTLGIVLASIMGGVLLDLGGINGMLTVGSVITFIGCILIFKSTKKRKYTNIKKSHL